MLESSPIDFGDPLYGYRKLPSLKEELVRARLTFPPQEGTQGHTIYNPTTTCYRPACIFCQNIKNKTRFTSTYTNRVYTKNVYTNRANCESKNLIYMLTCSKCGKQYIGETKRALRIRISEHLSDIKHKRDKPVSHHFNKTDHDITNCTFEIIQVMAGDPDSEPNTAIRRRTEMYWIHQLRTMHPLGLNSRDDL